MRKDHKAGDVLLHDMSFAAQTNDVPDGYIAGIASSPTVDCYGHRVLPGAFDKSIRKRGFFTVETLVQLTPKRSILSSKAAITDGTISKERARPAAV